MKKFYFFILTALLMLVSVPANALDVILNIDNPDNIQVSVNYGAPLENLVAGDNIVSADEYQSVSITAKPDALITKIVKSMEGADDTEEYVSNMTSYSLYMSSYTAGAKYTITTAKADEVRDGSCRIYVDDPSKVKVQRSGTYTDITLAEGWNDVKYMTDKELPLTIGGVSYDAVLYQVKLNDEVVEPQGTSWRISPATGDKIEIFANFPDIDVPVKFSYTSEEAKGFVTGVTVDGTPVDNYNDDSFTVKAGSTLAVSGNTNDYSLSYFKVNGNSTYFYGSYSMVVTSETNIEIDAHKYSTVKAILDIDYPENVIVYRGYSYNGDVISGLVSGENTIELSETNTMIQIKAASGCFISSVTAGGSPVSADYDGAYNVTVTEGMSIIVTSGAIERDSKAVVYVDDRLAATQYFSFMRSDRTAVDIATGYNDIAFYEGDNPFGLSWCGAPCANVYLNNEPVAPMYENSTVYELNLNDGDVVKIFLASDPDIYNATINAGENLDAGKVSVTFDRINNVTDWAKTHSVLPGTEISIKPVGDYKISVKADDTAIAPDASGAFVVKVNKDSTIAVNSTSAGIDGIVTDATGECEVYNLQGIRVSNDNDLTRLPAGIYIVNGKKVVKR